MYYTKVLVEKSITGIEQYKVLLGNENTSSYVIIYQGSLSNCQIIVEALLKVGLLLEK